MRDENASTAGSANDVLKALRAVFRFAMDYEIITHNPMRVVPLLRGFSEGFKVSTIFDIEKYEARWPVGTQERPTLDLLVYTGQRRIDIIVLGRQHEKDGWLYFTQHNNRERKPVHMSLLFCMGSARSPMQVQPAAWLIWSRNTLDRLRISVLGIGLEERCVLLVWKDYRLMGYVN